MPGGQPGDTFLSDTAHLLEDQFGIHHATLQIEREGCPGCSLEPVPLSAPDAPASPATLLPRF